MAAIPTPSLSTGSIPSTTPEALLDSVYAPVPSEVKTANPRNLTPYTIKYQNWYKTIPYAFRIVTEDQQSSFVGPSQSPPLAYFFPVNPESLNISTPYAVQVTPTIGGIVEEHSGAVFYNITVAGTTGVIPDINFTTGVSRSAETELRPLAAASGLIPAGIAGGFGQSTIGALNGIVSAITGTSSKLVDGTKNDKSGYTAFHVLYKFLWMYHFAKANGAKYSLRFVNYKDNNQYNVVVQNFQLTRDKGRPHLYQYSIQLRGWKLSALQDQPSFTDPDRLKNLGLDEGPSAKALIFRAIMGTKAVLNGASGLLNAVAQDLAF